VTAGEIYKAAATHNATVVGGEDPDVGLGSPKQGDGYSEKGIN
jgi:hypothetical protein